MRWIFLVPLSAALIPDGGSYFGQMATIICAVMAGGTFVSALYEGQFS